MVCLGSATRLIKYIQDQEKVYEAAVTLGAISDTDDAEGQLTRRANCPQPSKEEVEAALARFEGLIEQVPPQYSALKVAGKRAYQLARKGETVALKPRQVQIKELQLLEYQFPTLQLETTVSKGTYIRALARDLGEKLGTGAFLSDLRRTRIGNFRVEAAIPVAELDFQLTENLANLLLPSLAAVTQLPQLAVQEQELELLSQGQPINSTLAEELPVGEVALTMMSKLVAIGGKENDGSTIIRPVLVLQQTP